jgi:RimJ/RimL family protein N-acetyltransferase
LLQRAEKLEGIEQINLTVAAGNPAARKGYEKFGFVCP